MKTIILSIVVAVAFISGAIIISKNGDRSQVNSGGNNVSIENGKQIIEITAKGGYQPRKSLAKAGLPTVIRFNTEGTFDCSSSIRIPSLKISKYLPQTGTTDIYIGTPEASTLRGSCGMGMYSFEVEFEL